MMEHGAFVFSCRQAAGLEVVAEVMESQAVLIASAHSMHKELVQIIQRRIEGYITATQ